MHQEQTGQILMRIMMFTVMLSSMSALMFNIVLPEISVEFGLSLAQVSWYSSGYILIYAFGTVTYGKLADRFQLKHILTFGLILFAGGSLIGLLAPMFWLSLAGRLLQAAGAAVIPATAMIIPVRYFSPERRGSAMSMTAVGLAIGSALGPVVSALILMFAHWRWLFVPSLLILILLPWYRKYLNDKPEGRQTSIDGLGGMLLAAVAAFLLLGVTYRNWLFVIPAIMAVPLFIARIRQAKEPFIQPKLFQNRQYTAGLWLTFLISCIANALYFLSPLLLSDMYRLSSEWIGFVMVPAAIASSIVGRLGGRLADRNGNAYLYTLASGSLIIGFSLLSFFAGISSVWMIAVFLIFGNVGQTFMQIALGNSMSTTLPRDQIGIGMGLFSMTNFVAQGIAAGVYSVLAELSVSSWNPWLPQSENGIFGNIYFVLAALHIAMLFYFRLRFDKMGRTGILEKA